MLSIVVLVDSLCVGFRRCDGLRGGGGGCLLW
jgi:hypothetical protein